MVRADGRVAVEAEQALQANAPDRAARGVVDGGRAAVGLGKVDGRQLVEPRALLPRQQLKQTVRKIEAGKIGSPTIGRIGLGVSVGGTGTVGVIVAITWVAVIVGVATSGVDSAETGVKTLFGVAVGVELQAIRQMTKPNAINNRFLKISISDFPCFSTRLYSSSRFLADCYQREYAKPDNNDHQTSQRPHPSRNLS